MTQNKRYKICLVGESLSGGGAEKAMAELSRYFCSKGIDVHTVIVLDKVSYRYSGTLLNLGKLKNSSNGPLNKLKRFMALRNYLRKNRFDYIIDFRIRVSFLQEYFIAKWLYDAPTVYTVHSSMTQLYFPSTKWQARAIYKNAFAMVGVSHAIVELMKTRYGLDANAVRIHNPIDTAEIENASNAFLPEELDYILAAGRMKENVKQFDKLIEFYRKTSLPASGIKLVILGDGPDKKNLQQLIGNKRLDDIVVLKGHIENPIPYMKNARFFVLSSKREGLPMVILESLAAATPVVSFDCVSGPGEMVRNRENGLLIENQDFDALAAGIETMVADADLYNSCKANARESVRNFSLENIGAEWLSLLKID